jgi:hypothetical protein
MWNATFPITTSIDTRLIVGTRNNASLTKELVRRSPRSAKRPIATHPPRQQQILLFHTRTSKMLVFLYLLACIRAFHSMSSCVHLFHCDHSLTFFPFFLVYTSTIKHSPAQPIRLQIHSLDHYSLDSPSHPVSKDISNYVEFFLDSCVYL